MAGRVRFNTVNLKQNLLLLMDPENTSGIGTIKVIHLYDKLFSLFVSRRGGLQQTLDQPIKTKFHVINWLTRFLILFLLFRLCLGILTNNYYHDLFLGNPFSNKDGKQTAVLMYIFFMCAFVYGFREYILRLEETGRLKIIRILLMATERGFNAELLNMNYHRCKQFQKWCHYIFISSFVTIVCSSNMVIFISIYLRGSQATYQVSFIMVHMIYVFVEWITFLLIAISGLCLTCYLLVIFTFFIRRFNTFNDSLAKLDLRSSMNDSILSKLNYQLIELLNDIGQWNNDTKYLLQYCIIVSSIISNFACYVGFLYGFSPGTITRTVTTFGLVHHMLVFIVAYLTSLIHSESIKSQRFYCKLLSKMKVHRLKFQLKSMEILDRLDSNLIGIHFGNFGIIRRSTCIIILLENASFLMLLSCNVRSFN
uniref:Gustatory receptor n=1 Tax=Tetranychus urticae TaxID=32264 RepID=T1JTP3_TETUR